MNGAHWIFFGLLGMGLLLMLAFSRSARPQTAAYRWARRCFWAYLLMEGAGALGLMGVNGINWLAITLLGWPGAAVLAALGSIG